MRVVRLHGSSDLRIHDEPVPSPVQGEALLRVTSVGICGSDLHWFCEGGIGSDQLTRPLVLGHEFAGLVESGLYGSKKDGGQRVAVDPAIPCGECPYCKEGNPNFCERLLFAGHSVTDGSLRDYLAWPTRCFFPLPDSLSDAEGVMLEPLGIAIHAIDLGHIKPGMSVGVFGCGPIGLLIMQVARAAGASVIFATDPLPHRLDAARELGAIPIQAGPKSEEAPEVRRLVSQNVGRSGVGVSFEGAGEDPAVETAVDAAKPGGRVVIVGIPAVDHYMFSASNARRKGLTIAICRRMKHTYPRGIRLVQSGQVDVRSLVTHHFPLEKISQAFATANQREGIKILVDL
jgi:L-iditol 2-dehydrogenase